MSHSNRNFVIAYILLVGLPLLGLAGILKSGRDLKAPLAIDGTWKIDSLSAHTEGQSCEKAISSLAAQSFAVSQSGKTLTLTLNNAAKTSAAGTLDGRSVTVPLAAADSSVSGCPAGQTYALTASIVPDTAPRAMNGTFSANDCSSCARIEFHAVREPKNPRPGAH
jgi:hypothetical protein